MNPVATDPAALLSSKIPPHTLEMERAVLGGLLLDRESLPKVLEILKPTDFFKDGHRKTFDAMVKLLQRSEPMDLLTLTEELRRSGALDEVGGPAVLAACVEEAATATHLLSYAGIVREKALRRDLIRIGTEMTNAGYKAEQDPNVLRQIALESLNSLGDFRNGQGPWAAATPAPDFVNSDEPDQNWLKYPFLTPGSITEIFSPPGIGKTHVGHWLAVELARRGKRVLLLDRDNSRREVRRRLCAWGATDVPMLKVLTRDEAPPLTDAQAWAAFPFHDYDLVIIDSLDASAEGIGEKDSAKPSRAISPILDIAHRADGPAILVLGNTVKSAEHGRGSGVIEDRADICFEVRDATDFRPTGTKPWWEELPKAGAAYWAERATRRKSRDRYRLAFVCSKFRVGEEPDSFILEVDLSTDPWTLTDVTTEVVQAGKDTKADAERQRQHHLDKAARGLTKEVQAAADAGKPMRSGEAEHHLQREHDLKRAEARDLLRDGEGKTWRTKILMDCRGKPKVLLPVVPGATQGGESEASTAEIAQSETPQKQRMETGGISADRMNTGRRKPISSQAASDAGFRDPRLFPPTGCDTPTAPLRSEEKKSAEKKIGGVEVLEQGRYAFPWPDNLPALGPRKVGPFSPCSGCGEGTWVRYGAISLCLTCVMRREGGGE